MEVLKTFYYKKLLPYLEKRKAEATGIIFLVFLFSLAHYTIFAATTPAGAVSLRIPVLLDTAEGLKQGSAVFSHGVRVGYIVSLQTVGLDADKYPAAFGRQEAFYSQGVIAILSLQRRFDFYPNYRIVSKNRTILAEKLIDLLPGDKADWDKSKILGNPHPWPVAMPKDQTVDVLELSHEEVREFQKTGSLPRGRGYLLRASNYDHPLHLIALILAENRPHLFKLSSNLRDITTKIQQGRGSIGAVINQDILARRVNELLKDSSLLVQEARDALEVLRENDSTIRFIKLAYSILLWWTFRENSN